jgi:hypothetical protein
VTVSALGHERHHGRRAGNAQWWNPTKAVEHRGKAARKRAAAEGCNSKSTAATFSRVTNAASGCCSTSGGEAGPTAQGKKGGMTDGFNLCFEVARPPAMSALGHKRT